MYRLMIAPEINVEPKITVMKMKTKVEMELTAPHNISNHIVINRIMEHNLCPIIPGGATTEESDSTTLKMREQIRRLTEVQRKLIIDTFQQVENNLVKSGLQVLVKLFAEHPQYKQIWPQFRAIPDSSLMNAAQLRKHASVYMCGMRSIIHSMLDGNELAAQMNRIAKAHIKWNVHRRHVMHLLEPLLEILKEGNDGQMDENTKTAWTTFYDIIANLIEIYRAKRT